ncbi:MAG: iron-sulfur cluster insertion protein ErpA [Rhodospirillales bacterium]
MAEAETAVVAGVTLSPQAIRRIAALLNEAENRGMVMRVAVSGGGCSGFKYGFSFDDAVTADDRVIEQDGARVAIDDVSWEYLAGAEIHFAEELIGAYFTVRNPNATSTCGCGTSFSVG